MLSAEEIYREHSKMIYKYLFSITHNADLSEELTQETFYQAIKSLKSFDKSCKVSTWLCAIAKNQLLSYRRKHPQADELDETMEAADDIETGVIARLGKIEILKRLHLVEEPYKEVLHLRLFGDLSFREIGDIFERSENWARVTFYRAKEKLRKQMEDYEYE